MEKINIFLDDANHALYQWDTGQKIMLFGVSAGARVDWVQGTTLLTVEAYESGGKVYADVPNILLQTSGSIKALVYVIDDNARETVYAKPMTVRSREKPSEYVYTETEVKSWEDLSDRVAALEDNPITPEDIGQAVESYLTENPVSAPVESVNGKTGAVELTASDVGAAGAVQSVVSATNESIYNAVMDMYNNGSPYTVVDYSATGNPAESGYVFYKPLKYFIGSGYRQYSGIALSSDDGVAYRYVSSVDFGEYKLFLTKLTAETLPNPEKLTFTGAVSAEYDGSEAVTVEIPEGGSGSDLSLGLESATVGQIAKITAVDDTGKPTAWEPVDLPGDETWEHICDIEVSGEDELSYINQELGGGFKKILISVTCGGNAIASTSSILRIKLNSTLNDRQVARLTPNPNWCTLTFFVEPSPIGGFTGYIRWCSWYASGVDAIYGSPRIFSDSVATHILLSLESAYFNTNTYSIYGVRA